MMAPQFDRPLRELLRAAACTLVRQGKGIHEIWFDHAAKFPRAHRNSKQAHRKCHSPSGGIAKKTF
jgi:hypothetical protein